MVAGKNNPQALARQASSPRLPPLPKLRVRRPNQAAQNPCIGMLSSVLSCWASQGYTAQGCAALEHSLRACMDAKVSRMKFGECEWGCVVWDGMEWMC